MKLHAGVKLPVVRQDSKCRRLKKLECGSPGLLFGKNRCTPSARCSTFPRASAKSYLVSCTACMVLILGLIAFLQVGSSVTRGMGLPRASILAVKLQFLIGREWRHIRGLHTSNFTYRGYVPGYGADSLECSGPEHFALANSIPSSSVKSSPTAELDYDVCLPISIGDDGDVPSETALPYPLVSRLTDALKEEATWSRSYLGKHSSQVVQVLVGVDYGSIVCAIVRDTFAELPDVNAQCVPFSELEQGTKCGKLVAGYSKRFVPQVSEQWIKTVEWQSRRLVDLDCLDPSHLPPALPEKDWQPTIVTGFSSNHMTVGLLLLRSIGKAVRDSDGSFNVSVVVWAMEVFDVEHQELLDCVIDELIQYRVKAEVRLFDWSAYPSWIRIDQNLGYFGGTGEYAWKAIMVHTVLRERGIVIWGDAGDRFHDTESLIETLKVLNATDFVSRTSHGYVFTRTHPLALKYFRANIPEIWDMENCEAAMVGFTLRKYTDIARPWYECSITRQCIAPDGSDRSNHRQDQAALTLLSILSKSPCTGAHPNFSHHADDDPTLKDISGTYITKCYADPLILRNQGTLKPPPANRPHGIIN